MNVKMRYCVGLAEMLHDFVGCSKLYGIWVQTIIKLRDSTVFSDVLYAVMKLRILFCFKIVDAWLERM